MCCLRNAIVEELVRRRFRTAERRGRDYIVGYKLVKSSGYPKHGLGKYVWGINVNDVTRATTKANYWPDAPSGYHVLLWRPPVAPWDERRIRVRCRLSDLIVAGPFVNGVPLFDKHSMPQAVFRSIEILPEDNPNVPLETFS